MLPKTTPEQRHRLYEDVESLLSPGFLTHPVVIAGVRLQLRSMGPGDLFMLRARGEGGSNHSWRVWMVATSVWMVNGKSLLGRDDAVPFMADYLRALPVGVLADLFSLVLGLFARSQRAQEAIEVYCYESLSRYKWATYGEDRTFEVSGVSGAAALGLNAVQQIWMAFNKMEDSRQSDEQQWEGFKLVASSNAPKAIQKMDTKDKDRRQKEVDQRQRKMDVFFYRRLGLVTEDGSVQGADGSMHRIEGAKTVEDLEDEMRRWVTDDYDLHDKVVAQYKAHIRTKHEQDRQERAERRQALERKREELGWESGDFRPQPLIAMTAAQLSVMLQERGGGPGTPGVTFLPTSPTAGRIYDKYVGEAPDVGRLQVVGDKVVDPGAQSATDERTLNDLIKSRNPAFGAGE
jgi:hypothetical protein